MGELLALHAGLGFDEEARGFIANVSGRWPPEKAEHPAGVIVGVARLVGVREPSPPRRGDDRWYMGGYGWLLDEVRVLAEPVPHKGALGLRALPPEVERQVRAQMRRRGGR